jgi:Domain of unknown function (DUF4157)
MMLAPRVATTQTRGDAGSTGRFGQPTSRQARDERDGDHEREIVGESLTDLPPPSRLAWDFGKIPLFPPDRTSRSQTSYPSPGIIQRKLTVGAVNDPLEHEADRVADQVMRTKLKVPSQASPGKASTATKRPSAWAEERDPGLGVRHEVFESCAAISASLDIRKIPIHARVPPRAQTNLAVNAPGDMYEQEAERAAQTVMKIPERREDVNNSGENPRLLELAAIQPISDGREVTSSAAPEALQSSGEPLGEAARVYFEPRFGFDFSKVKVHRNPEAERSASDLRAPAYTLGQHIVFGPGRYAPGTSQGRRLLAHELAHVVQQSGGSGRPSDTHAVSAAPRISSASQTIQRGPQDSLIPEQSKKLDEQRQMKGQVQAAVDRAQKAGVPVKFLNIVINKTTFEKGDPDKYTPFSKTVDLSEKTMRGAGLMSDPKIQDSLGIATIYHEATHAYLDQHKDEEPVKHIYEQGVYHYAGAPTREGGETSDAEEVFQEASAGYVAGRVASWWIAFSALKSNIRIGALTPDKLSLIKDRYNYSMSGPYVEGYSTEGHWYTLSRHQASTLRPISNEMKVFLDEQVLEGKIPDQFDQVAVFMDLLNAYAVAQVNAAKKAVRYFPVLY